MKDRNPRERLDIALANTAPDHSSVRSILSVVCTPGTPVNWSDLA